MTLLNDAVKISIVTAIFFVAKSLVKNTVSQLLHKACK